GQLQGVDPGGAGEFVIEFPGGFAERLDLEEVGAGADGEGEGDGGAMEGTGERGGAEVEGGGGDGVEEAEGEALIGGKAVEFEPGAEVEGPGGDGEGLGDAVVGDVLGAIEGEEIGRASCRE